MNSSEPNPKLPTWLFIVTDLAFIGAAALIAWFARPLTPTMMFLIVGCVTAGAIFALVPLVARFERQKNETLDDRQRALEALARTVAASAEQISIATGGLHEITELAQKNLRHAEQLPHKLQEKIAEFQAQIASSNDAEKEELEKELLSLRTSESERLDAVSQRIGKSTAEWTKLEAAAHQHLAAANDAVAKLSASTVTAIARAQAAAEQSLSHSHVEAARTIGDASVTAARAVEIAEIFRARRSRRQTHHGLGRVGGSGGERTQRKTRGHQPHARRKNCGPRSGRTPARGGSGASSHTGDRAPAHTRAGTRLCHRGGGARRASGGTNSAAAADSAPEATPAAPSPKRTRKPRRDESVAAAEPAPAPVAEPAAEPTPAGETVAPVSDPVPAIASSDVAPVEPAPILVEKIPEVTPVAPHTAEPFGGLTAPIAATPAETPPAVEPVVNAAAAPIDEPTAPPAAEPAIEPAVEPENPARKRAPARKPESDDEPGLGLDLDDAATGTAAGAAERVMTSDGATRLIVTAYIGIGNRLFIRGEGPGLSWEKGVPLQFVSIGKWRWETSDATAPIQFKIYKNDDLECTALGSPTIDPGQQQELSATF